MTITKFLSCFLCAKTESEPLQYYSTSAESSFLLYHLLDLPNLEESKWKTFQKVNYCSNCLTRIQQTQSTLEKLEKLEKEILQFKDEVELKFKESSEKCQRQFKKLNSDPDKLEFQLRSDIVSELKSRTILAMVENLRKKNLNSRLPKNSVRVLKAVSFPRIDAENQNSLPDKVQNDNNIPTKERLAVENPVPSCFHALTTQLINPDNDRANSQEQEFRTDHVETRKASYSTNEQQMFNEDPLKTEDVDLDYDYDDTEMDVLQNSLTPEVFIEEVEDGFSLNDYNHSDLIIEEHYEESDWNSEAFDNSTGQNGFHYNEQDSRMSNFDNGYYGGIYQNVLHMNDMKGVHEFHSTSGNNNRVSRLAHLAQPPQSTSIPGCSNHSTPNTSVSINGETKQRNRILSVNTAKRGIHHNFLKPTTKVIRRSVPNPTGEVGWSGSKYICQTCNDLFPTMKELISHRSIHMDTLGYKCHLCSKRFKLKGNLTVHLRVHTGERPFQCALCDMKFAHVSNLRAHEKRTHRSVVEESFQYNLV